MNAFKLFRSLTLLVLATACLPQTALASGTLYVNLYGGKQVVKFKVGANAAPSRPISVTATVSAPEGLAVRGSDLYFQDNVPINGLGTYVIRRIDRNATNGQPAPVVHGQTAGRAAAALAFDSGGSLYFVGSSGWDINRLASGGTTSTAIGTGSGPGCGIVFDGTNTVYSTHQDYGHPNSKHALYKLNLLARPGSTMATALVQNSSADAVFGKPCAMAIDKQGSLYVGDVRPTAAGLETIVWKLDPKASNPRATMAVYAVVGARNPVNGLTFDDAGNLYATVGAEHKIFRIDPRGVSTVFQTLIQYCPGTSGCYPWGIAFVPDPPPRVWIGRWEPWMAFVGGVVLIAVIGATTLTLRRRRARPA